MGGLIGNNYGNVTSCYSTGYVEAKFGYDIGGLIGSNYGALNKCYSSSILKAADCNFVGGLVGINYNIATESYSTGDVGSVEFTSSDVGGLLGSNLGMVKNCYSTGKVYGYSNVGGLIGLNDSTIINCYSCGKVSGNSTGMTGTNNGTVLNSFWDLETSGQKSSTGGEGKTTSKMKNGTTFIFAGWNSSIWYLDKEINDSYPYLFWQNQTGKPIITDEIYPITYPTAGDGSKENPFEIETMADLTWLTANNTEWDKYYVQTVDIDLSETSGWFEGEGWQAIGNESVHFTGNYNGQGHTISGLFIDKPTINYQGLFGYVEGVISNLGL